MERVERRIRFLAVPLAVLSFSAVFPATAGADSTDYAKRIFQRIAGVPLVSSDPRIAQMATLIDQGKPVDAAAIATSDPNFYDVTLRNFAAPMSNKLESPMVELDDFQATVAGATRDDLDARTLLTGNYLYIGNDPNLPAYDLSDNQHFEQMESNHEPLLTSLVKASPQPGGLAESAGLLTSRSWGQAHYIAGTNRRAVQYTFQEFLCAPIAQWRDSSLPDFHIRRDVDRAPSGDPANFQNKCRGCHAPMDAMGGAFAHFDFSSDTTTLIYDAEVVPKMNKNNTVYPDGYVTFDDSWQNLIPQSQGEAFGWRGPVKGNGVNAFASMIANSQAFTSCMVTRVFKQVCKRPPGAAEAADVATLGTNFEAEGYDFKKLFQETAATSSCLADGSLR